MRDDFDRWVDYHGQAYPAFLEWLVKPDNIRHKDHMRRLLGHYTYDQLRDATDALFADEKQPHGFSNHARAIRRHCNPAGPTAGQHEGPELRDGELVAECTRCMDYGTLEVVSPACLKLLYKHAERPAQTRVRTCMIACDCRRGDSKARRLKVCQWANGRALFQYEEIINQAVAAALNFEQLLDAEWAVARRLLYEHHDATHQPQELSAEVLP